MNEVMTKLETLEKIAQSDSVLAIDKVCIFSDVYTVLPKEVQRDLLNQFIGAINMAEYLYKSKDKKQAKGGI